VEYELWDSLVDPAFDWSSPAALLLDSAYSSLPLAKESRVRLLYVGSSVVDGNLLNDGRVLPSPPSDSEEVDEARISAAEEEGRRCTMGGTKEVVGIETGIVESSTLPR